MFDIRMLRRIFGPKGDEVGEMCRKLRKDELRDLYSSPGVIRMMKARKKGG
jgi:hypothetical protein